MKKSPWQTISSKEVYKNYRWSVVADEVIKPSGNPGEYYTVTVDDFVTVIPLEKNKKDINLVRMYRYPIKQNSWEVVEGFIDKGETPLQAAKRELKEETGFTAKKFTKIGFNYLGNGLTNQGFYIFVAYDLTPGQQALEEGEMDMIYKKFSVSEVNDMIAKGKITDSPTVVSMYFLNNFIKKL